MAKKKNKKSVRRKSIRRTVKKTKPVKEIKKKKPRWLSTRPKHPKLPKHLNRLPKHKHPKHPKHFPKHPKFPTNPPIDLTIHKTKIRVIGIGGGGGTIVSEIAARIKKADFYVANTDVQALNKSSSGAKRFQFGQSLTKGLGTGMNPELGEAAAQADKEKIKKLLEGQDLCVIISCLGGGTSSGATPVFANISKGLGNITYGIFTLPFRFEGEKKMEAALQSLEKIKNNFNVYTVIPNERIFQIIEKNTPLADALSAINKRLTDNLEGLIDMIYSPGLINIDFADLRTILSGRGRLTYLSSVEAEGPNKYEVIKKLISNPLYQYSIKGAKGILYNIVSGKNIQLSDISQISNMISESISRNGKIIFGIGQDRKYEDKIKVTLLAAGCSVKAVFASSPSLKPAFKKIRVLLKKKKRKKKLLEIEKKSKEILAKPQKLEDKVEKIIKKVKPRPIIKRENTKRKFRLKPRIEVKIKTELKPKLEQEVKLVSISSVLEEEAGPEFKKEQKENPEEALKEKPKEEEKTFLKINYGNEGFSSNKVRKNALQVRKEAEEEEKELLEQENLWETPAILRRKQE